MKKRTIKARMTLLILLTFCLYFVAGTYARYTSTASGTAEVQVAKWAVSLNAEDMTADAASFDVEFTEVDNANVVNGKIAPATELYADFEVDPTGSDVAIDYSFELGDIVATSGTLPDTIAVTKVVLVEDDDSETTITETNGKYSGTIALVDQTKSLTADEAVTVRVYVAWEDENTEAANTADTAFGVEAPAITMEVTATAAQHVE